MRVLHWCVLAVTLLLLACEVAVSQLCKSLITLVDGFHTLFIFISMALPPPPPPPQAASIIKPVSPSPNPPLPTGPPPTPVRHTTSNPPAGTRGPVRAEPSCGASSPGNAPEPACRVSHRSSRVRPVGAFLSALLLASLCVSYLIQIISFSLDPHPVQRPLVLVLVGAVSVLHKTLLLRLNWDQLRARVHEQPGAQSHIEVNHRACEPPGRLDRPVPSGRRAACLPSLVAAVARGLLTSLLALGYSLVMLLGPHGAGARGLLVYLDPALALLAVVTLVATARPQMCRYGLMLLQATPPHISVPELERRIAGVPGVQAVHDLHVWQLAESLTVASAHVHCSATLPAHRCAELISGVTKVLQSVGVSCCTVQPEFTQCSEPPVVRREEPCLPPVLACSLACGRACARSMCCSPHEEEASSPLAPPAGASKEEPQSLVIENTFL